MNQPPPNQYEVEDRLNSLFRHGDKKAVAQWLDRDEGQLSKQIRPDGESDSEFYRGVRFIDACYRARHQLGRDVRALLESLIAGYETGEGTSEFPAEAIWAAARAHIPGMVEFSLPAQEKKRLARIAITELEKYERGADTPTPLRRTGTER